MEHERVLCHTILQVLCVYVGKVTFVPHLLSSRPWLERVRPYLHSIPEE